MPNAITNDATPTLWAPLQSATLSWQIVSQVRQALAAGHIKPGDFLGSEAGIAQQFNVSRMAARDALRTLEALGIVEIKMGIKGGASIAQGNPDRFADALSIQLQLIGVSAEEIFDAQAAIEMFATELAANCASPGHIDRMRDCLAACEKATADPDSFTGASMRFHELVVEASGNRVLLAQFRGLRHVLHPLLAPYTTQEVMARVLKSSSALVSAIAAGDAEKARSVMRERIERVRAKVLGAGNIRLPVLIAPHAQSLTAMTLDD